MIRREESMTDIILEFPVTQIRSTDISIDGIIDDMRPFPFCTEYLNRGITLEIGPDIIREEFWSRTEYETILCIDIPSSEFFWD
jgi:hypothetical protein